MLARAGVDSAQNERTAARVAHTVCENTHKPIGANCVRPRTDKDVRPYALIKFALCRVRFFATLRMTILHNPVGGDDSAPNKRR